MVEKRRLFLSTDDLTDFVDGVAVRATEKGDVLSFVTNPEGGLTPEYPGIPRQEVLKELDAYKRTAETLLELMHVKFKDSFLKVENLPPSLKEVHRLFGVLIDCEGQDRMKQRWEKIRDLVILAFYEDTSYRFRAQFMLEKADIKKLIMTDDDRFWFKTRYGFDMNAAKY